MAKFFVVSQGEFKTPERRVFEGMGYEHTDKLEDARIVIFRGGEDINPFYYGEKRLPGTFYNDVRDSYEAGVFSDCEEDQILVGICRGAQFLNCLFGGTLWQDVDKHAGAPHINTILDKKLSSRWGNPTVTLNSYHHQMVRDLAEGFDPLVATALSTRKVSERAEVQNEGWDMEVAWSKEKKTLLFQAHPEFGHDETERFFKSVFTHVTEGLI